MLTVENLTKTYRTSHGNVQASRSLTFELRQGEVLSLVGPSGCGKTTALRCIAGLESPDHGRIVLGDATLYENGAEMPAHRRRIGMVFQSYAIWPHLSVFDNVAYPLRVQRPRISRSQIQQKVGEALETVRIGELARRRATMLSGGQQQRVAIARALVRDADLLLFDEPLSNLDAKLRDEMRSELRILFQAAGVSVLYVTHDLGEALALSDRLLVLDKGRIAQEGRPEDIYFRPANEFVARFLGNTNLLPATVTPLGAGRAQVESELATIAVATVADCGRHSTMVVRPDALCLQRDDAGGAEVETLLFLGSMIEVGVRLRSGTRLTAKRSSDDDRLAVGDRVSVCADPRGVSLVASAVAEPAVAASIEPADELVGA
jgi:iron(III) transport system ATP-binding protein